MTDIIINILVALATVVAIAILMGTLLALVTHFFSVKESRKKLRARACLPGVNCGACGFKGCDDYAAALAEGNAAPNLCVPGGEDTAKALGEVLGMEVGEIKREVAFVHCNGNPEATSKKAEYVGISTCRAASMIYGGPNTCSHGCLGYGDCEAVCPANAICVMDGIAHVNASLCMGCGICSSVCPKHVISMVPRDAGVVVMCSSKDKGADARKACKNACIGCKKCEKTCPNGAIKVANNLATIDYEKCTGCGACAKGCPTGCLKDVSFGGK